MNFTAIDFETANASRGSVCALGLVRVENGLIAEQKHWLVRPQEMYFHPMNISIHGIRPEDVEKEAEFDVLYQQEVRELLEGQIIIAHNAAFDISVLRHCLDSYGLEYPTFDYLCTVKTSQRVYPQLSSHKLNVLADHLGLELDHHQALSDASACAQVLLHSVKKMQHNSLEDFTKAIGMQKGRLYTGGYKACSIAKIRI
jgi:DNA polymerase III subunit epsilon